MVLQGRFKIVGIRKKTKAKWFKDLEVGDEFYLKYYLTGRYKDSPDVIICDENGERVHKNIASQLKNNLSNFEVIQMNVIK